MNEEESDITPPPSLGRFGEDGYYPQVPYHVLPKPRPTSGNFDELHPFQSDYSLVTKYPTLTEFTLEQPESHTSSRQTSLHADQIRMTWGLEATHDDTIGREVSSNELITRLDRAIGIVVGLACGDALGRPVEFKSPSEIQAEHGELRDFKGDGTHGQPAGTVTDDTNLALYLIGNLLTANGFDSDLYAEQLVEWYESDPFDVGLTTMSSIKWLQNGFGPEEAGHKTLESRGEQNAAGNGSIMRCAPLAIAYPDDWETLHDVSRESSSITHADERCTHSCAALNLTLAAILQGSDDPLSEALDALSSDAPDSLVERLGQVPNGIDPTELKNTGYVLDTLETALYLGLTADTPEEALVTAVNKGGDADTIAAITGAIVGARFGAGWRLERASHKPDETFPTRWVSSLKMDLDTYQNYLIPALLEVGQLSTRGITADPTYANKAIELARNNGQTQS